MPDLRMDEGFLLVFCRHGEVAEGSLGRFMGSTDVELSPRGAREAERLADDLMVLDPDTIVSSPLRRARLTAQPICDRRGIEARTIPELAEHRFGLWEAMTWDEMVERHPEEVTLYTRDKVAYRFPGGESALEFHERVGRGLARLLEEARQARLRSVAVVAHFGVCRSILSHLTGMDYAQSFQFHFDYGCVNIAKVGPTGWLIVGQNLRPGLDIARHGEHTW